MDLSQFLAKALGIYLTVVSISMFVNAYTFKNVINEVLDNTFALYLSGIIAFIIGILMVLSHNLWVSNWRVLVTLAGWLSFIKGLLIILFPQSTTSLSRRFVQSHATYYISAAINLGIGLILCYFGFFKI